MDLQGKTAFVTGGSGELGGAMARALAAAGTDVAISYVGHLAGATATVEAVQVMGRQALAVQLDQRDSVAIEAAVAQVVGTFGRVDILVNNAAWNIGIPFPDLDALGPEVWDRILDTNLRGPYLLARAVASHLRAHEAGRIVNIASVGGLYPASSSIASP
jgi:3-oxoacyl-[acyl-carrier protein] reductase